MAELITISIGVLLLSHVAVGLVRQWAEQQQVLDIPNERSSHSKPTPSGGGLAIVFCSVLGLVIYWLWSPHYDLVLYRRRVTHRRCQLGG